MTTTISVRKARAADIPVLASLEREFDRDERSIVLKADARIRPYMRAPSTTTFKSQRMRKWIASTNCIVFIAEADSIPCGFTVAWIGTSPEIFRPKRYGFIGIMFVRREYRGRGVSSLMIKETLAWFAKRKVKHVGLTVVKQNRHARRVYQKWGFADFVVNMWKMD